MDNVDEKYDRTLEKGRKTAKHRHLKNFLFWLFGFFSCIVTVGTAGVIAVTVLPVGTYLPGSQNAVGSDVTDDTLLSIIKNYKDYKVGDFPILAETVNKAIQEGGLGDYVEVDVDALNKISLGDSNIGDSIKGCLKIVASVSSLNLDLGGIENLDVFTTASEVSGEVDPTASDFNAKLYYYKTSSGKYERAYNDDKTRVAPEGAELYYPPLGSIPVLEAFSIIDVRLGQAKATNLLGVFTTLDDDSLLTKVLGDKTVKELGSISANEILLKDVLTPGPGNQKVYDILLKAVVIADGEEPRTIDTLTVGDLSNVNIDEVPLTTVVSITDDNRDMFQAIADAVGKANPEDVIIGDISKADMDEVNLNSFIKESDNADLYKVLRSATSKGEGEDVYLGDLKSSSFSIKNIKLSDVMTPSDSKVKNMLVQATGASSYEAITINMLESMNLSNVTLDAILDSPSDTLKNIISEAAGLPGDWESVTVGSLSSFNVNLIHLNTVLPEGSDTLYSILSDATGKDRSKVTIADLSGSNFNIENIKLATFFGDPNSESNPILKAILKKDGVTVKTLGSTISDLSAYEIFGENCFTHTLPLKGPKDKYEAVEGKPGEYRYSTTVSDADAFYINPDSNFWVLYSYEVTEKEATTGRGNYYKPSTTTFGNLTATDDSSSDSTSAFTNATLYQLIAAGIIDDDGYSNTLKSKSIKEILDLARALP